MFEIRISNNRTFIFTYLIIMLTFTFTIAFDNNAYQFFEGTNFPGGADFFIGLGSVAIFSMIYASMGMDRYALEQFQSLTMAREKLSELKKKKMSG